MRQSLELKLGQRLALTPQLQQAIKLLQLSAIDLRMEMQEALEQNPLLEEADDFADDQENGESELKNRDNGETPDFTSNNGDDSIDEIGQSVP